VKRFGEDMSRRLSAQYADEEQDTCSESDKLETTECEEEFASIPPIELEQDMFGASICMLMRDAHFISVGKGSLMVRYSRLFTTTLLLMVCICTQAFLLYKFKQFVTAKAVHDIRGAYDKFELTMYDNYTVTVNGNHRGVGPFRSENFGKLSEDEQSSACRIPLSQPDFFFVILSIWSLTCAQQFKKVKEDWNSLIMNTKRCAQMKDSQTDMDGEEGNMVLISSLTLSVKAAIIILVLVPRTLITGALLWLGCRWLLATNNFADLVLNAVALEFVLLLKDSLYLSLMSPRNKMDMANTQIKSPEDNEKASVWAFTGTVGWMFLSFAWVVAFMGIPHVVDGWQTVLPDYKWDVQHVCESWIKWRYCVQPPCPASPLIQI